MAYTLIKRFLKGTDYHLTTRRGKMEMWLEQSGQRRRVYQISTVNPHSKFVVEERYSEPKFPRVVEVRHWVDTPADVPSIVCSTHVG